MKTYRKDGLCALLETQQQQHLFYISESQAGLLYRAGGGVLLIPVGGLCLGSTLRL